MSSSRAEASGIVRTDFRNRSTWSIFQVRYQATSRFFLSFVSISRGGGAVHLEPLVEAAAGVMRPLEVEPRLANQLYRPAELGEVNRLGLVDDDDRPQRRDDCQDGQDRRPATVLAGTSAVVLGTRSPDA